MKIKTKLATVVLSFLFVVEASAFCIPEWIPLIGGICFGEENEGTDPDLLWSAQLVETPANQLKVVGVRNVCDYDEENYDGADRYDNCFFGDGSACVPGTCATLGKTCGTWDDGCGGTVTCGSACCTPSTCAALGKTCGDWDDGCGGTVSCGSACCDCYMTNFNPPAAGGTTFLSSQTCGDIKGYNCGCESLYYQCTTSGWVFWSGSIGSCGCP